MKIAIVLVNYRNADDTIACLESIRASGGSGFAIFVIENDSGDGSGAKLAGYLDGAGMDARLIAMDKNIGFASGCNAGIRAALDIGCTHVLLLNNDTVVGRDFAPGLAAAAARNPESVVAGFISDLGTGRPAKNYGRISGYTFLIEFDYSERPGPASEIDFVSGCMMLVPASVFEKAGLLKDEYFLYCEDLEFCLRLKRLRIPVKYDSGLAVAHRVSSSVTKTDFPKEYYRMRNHTSAVLEHGNLLQKALYASRILGVMAKKAGNPGLFREFKSALADALGGRLGTRGKALR